ELEQTWAETSCGPLFEFRTLSASGHAKLGAQQVTLGKFQLVHTTDSALSIETEGSAESGSLEVPFRGKASLQASTVTRDEPSCQLNGFGGPLSGAVDLWLGTPTKGLGLEFDWSLGF